MDVGGGLHGLLLGCHMMRDRKKFSTGSNLSKHSDASVEAKPISMALSLSHVNA